MTLVTDLMKREVVTCGPEQAIEELLALLRQHEVSGLPVVDEAQNLLGVVSASDVLRKSSGLKVKDLMSTVCAHVGEFTTVRQAANLMSLQRVHRLIVTSEQRRVIGVITSLDLVSFLSRLSDESLA